MASGSDPPLEFSGDKSRLQDKKLLSGAPLKRPHVKETFATTDSYHGNKESLLNETTHWRKPKTSGL